MAAQLIDGKAIAARIRRELKERVARLTDRGATPVLHSVQVGSDPGSNVYIGAQRKACEKIGIRYELHQLEKTVGQDLVDAEISRLNQDPSANGIILQMPVPAGLNGRALQARILPEKDAEGVAPANMGQVVYGAPTMGPCTAMAAVELVKSTGVELYGKEFVMVGHSDIVGKPTALLLLDQFATTSVCHIATGERGNLADYVQRAEILVVAVGKAGLIKGSWIREGAVVVDVGINRMNGKLVGDVEFEPAQERAAYITPVPGGVGPVTTAMLLKNVVTATELQHA